MEIITCFENEKPDGWIAGTGKKRIKITCEHCGKTVAKHIIARYHGDKCKWK